METWVKALLLFGLIGSLYADVCSDYCYCPTGTSLICNFRDIDHPPPGYWPDVEEALFSYNHISAIHTGTFTGMPNVHKLYLAVNQLHVFDPEVYTSMYHLELLSLATNEISMVLPAPENVSLPYLETLYLGSNLISTLSPNLLNSFAPNLKTLSLNNNTLRFSAGLPFLVHQKLETLSLQNMKGAMGTVNAESFSGLPQLTSLDLQFSGVTSIDGAFDQNPKLKTLNLRGNTIMHIVAGTFSSGGVLTSLRLRENPLRQMDVSAVSKSMPYGNLDISETPLACSCNYDGLYWWAIAKGLSLAASCNGDSRYCTFTRKF